MPASIQSDRVIGASRNPVPRSGANSKPRTLRGCTSASRQLSRSTGTRGIRAAPGNAPAILQRYTALRFLTQLGLGSTINRPSELDDAETNLSAQKATPCESPRFPLPFTDLRWPRGVAPAPVQGPASAGCLVVRPRGPAAPLALTTLD